MAIMFEPTKGIDKETGKRFFKFTHKDFNVLVDESGVKLSGFSPYFRTPNDFDDLAQVIGAATTQMLKLQPHMKKGGHS